MNIAVVHYESDNVPNPKPEGATSIEEFWRVRTSILAVSQEFGATGPESEAEEPCYWLVDDQYNDELYQNIQVYKPGGWNTEWLFALAKCLQKNHHGWGIHIGNIDQGHIVVFADRLMVTGSTFANCCDIESVVAAAKLACERLENRRIGPLLKQLDYIRAMLPNAMKEVDTNGFAYLATFDGYQLYDGNAIWILQNRSESELILDTEFSPIRTSAVTADTSLHAEYCKDFWPYTDVVPPYWLLTYIVEDKSQTSFNLVDKNTNTVGSITIERVITDELLRELTKHSV